MVFVTRFRCLTNPASAAGDQPRGSEFYVPLIAIGQQHPSGA
jgi:hypothetical protein